MSSVFSVQPEESGPQTLGVEPVSAHSCGQGTRRARMRPAWGGRLTTVLKCELPRGKQVLDSWVFVWLVAMRFHITYL